MKFRHAVSCGFVLAALALTGCDEGRTRPPQASARVVNVAPGFAEVQFRRERVNPQQLGFKSVQEFTWDVDTYDFYVLERSLGTATGREWTISRQLSADVGSYTFVLADNHGEISFIVVENPDSDNAQAQVAGVHAAVDLPAMDVYLVAPGAGIVGAAPRGTLAPLGQFAAQTLTPGEYEIWLTAAGNPSNVLLASPPTTLTAGLATLIVTPEGGETTADLSVVVLHPAFSTTVYDRNATAELRVINGAADTTPRDFAINREFSPPLFANIPFATPTPHATVPIALDQPINVTPVGNPGVLELDQLFGTLPTQRWTLLFGGAAGTLTHALALDDNRSIHGEAKLRFLNSASQFLFLSYVITPVDGNPAFFPTVTSLSSPGISDYVPLPAGDWDLYALSTADFSVVSGPTRVSVAAGGVYSALSVNGTDATTAALVLLDGFN